MAQIVPRRGWLVTFAQEATCGSNPLGEDYHELTLRLFASEHPEAADDAHLPGVVVRPDADPDELRARPGITSVEEAWYVAGTDEAYHPELRGPFFDDLPGVGLWTDLEEALTALAEYHEPTRLLVDLWQRERNPVRSLASAVLEGDEEALGPLSDALAEHDHPAAGGVRRLFQCRAATMRAAARTVDVECGRIAALFPDGRYAVSFGVGNWACVCDLETGRTVHTLPQHGLVAAVSAQGDRIALGDQERVRIYRWPEGDECGATEAGQVLAFSPDGHWLVGATSTGVWMRDLAELSPGTLPIEGPNDIAFSPDGQFLAGAGQRGVSWWRGWSRTSERRQIGYHLGRAECVRFAPNSALLAACGGDTVRLWDVARTSQVGKFVVPRAAVLTFSPDGRLLAVGTSNGDIRIYSDLPTARYWASWRAHAVHGTRLLAFLPDGQRLLSQDTLGTTTVWNLAGLLGK
jgi:sugar lactone lactonase YvrE